MPRLLCVRRLRRSGLLLAAVAVLPVGMAVAGSKPKLTVIGDSVADQMEHNPAALASLGDGYRLNLQTRGCRNTVTPSCTIAGASGPPPTVLDVVHRFGTYLGTTVVIESGYNDHPSEYRHDLDTVLRALQTTRVKTVVWLTLRDPKHAYQSMNKVIWAAPKRWPNFVVADWDKYSAGHPDWFNLDDGFGGVHPTPLGAAALGQFIHASLTQRALATRPR